MMHYLQNSNIIQFFSMLKKDDPSQQMVYYQVGWSPRGTRGFNRRPQFIRPE